ncbi:MAG: sugar transferase, partial [Alphaproteobacteria bacterium]|nr:sugar transferase [Alphaproteobacteria bacterium]
MVRNGKAYDITPGMTDDAVAVLRVAMVVLTSILAKSVYIDLYLGDNKDLWPYLAVGIIAAFLSHLVFGAGAPRKAGRSRTAAALFVHLAMALALTFLILISIGYLLKIAETYSRGWMITWFVFAIVGVGCVELIGGRLRRLLGERGYFKRRVAIYGAGETATRLLAHLVQDQADIEIVGVWDDAAPNASRADIAGGLADLVRLARDNKVDHVVLAGAAANPGRIEAVLDDLTQLPINIHLASDFISFSLVEPSFLKLGNANLVEIQTKPLTGWSPWKKALVDYVFACLFLILASPLIAVVALAIKLDSPGPVFFRQRRHGFNNQEIDVIKFRTMYVG